jgi:hypothetical protein
MEQDRSSVKSNDSGGGFEFVSSGGGREDQPELKIANNGDLEELKQSLNEVLTEERSMEEQGKRVSTNITSPLSLLLSTLRASCFSAPFYLVFAHFCVYYLHLVFRCLLNTSCFLCILVLCLQ